MNPHPNNNPTPGEGRLSFDSPDVQAALEHHKYIARCTASPITEDGKHLSVLAAFACAEHDARVAAEEELAAAAYEIASYFVESVKPSHVEEVRSIIDKHYAAQREAIGQAIEAIEAYASAYTPDGHTVPHDCFATGPKTGDAFQDYIFCPGCHAEHLKNNALKQLRAVHSGGSTGQAREGGAS